MPDQLTAALDAPLPREIAVGRGTAVFTVGWAVAPGGDTIAALSFALDGAQQPVPFWGAPRPDVAAALHDDAGTHSGFWGVVTVPPGTGPRELRLRARLASGAIAETTLATLGERAVPDPVRLPAGIAGDGPLVGIAMASYEPPPDLLRAQLDSIRAQTHEHWVCVISDDCSSPAAYAALEREVAGDPRFVLSRSPRRLGFYANFERALALVPREAAHVALADQDDRWDPDKLATLLAALGSAQLVFSDARIVTPAGELVSPTYWAERRNEHDDLLSVLVANSVTGAASLLQRELLDVALPFPPGQFSHFHDHWLALCALAVGEIAWVDRPLYDYVQHADASLGHATANRVVPLRARLGNLRRDPRERIGQWRMIYFADVQRLMQVGTVLTLRAGDRMAPARRRALETFLSADAATGPLATLLARGIRELTGRPATLGAELVLFYGLVWRRLLTASSRLGRGPRLSALPPRDLTPKPGRMGPAAPAIRVVDEKIAPLELAPADDAPVRVNLLLPTIDLEHFFGGYIGKLNLARRLAERGRRVRLVTVDPVGPLPGDWRARLEGYAGLAGVWDRVEVAFGREAAPLEVHRDDAWIATTWWTAHQADAARRALDRPPFLYLIQEYEPFTFPAGTWAALARESYTFPHRALFSTELLREWFRGERIGVYATGPEEGDAVSVSFQNAITAVPAPTAAELAARTSRRLLFYARPEDHAARNMFELGALALARAARDGVLAGWELNGIGTTSAGSRVELGGGAVLRLLPRAAQGTYADLLRDHDVGLALMDTPHPSLVPLEMASAGMRTVTSTYANKTAEAMRAISENLLAVPPTVGGVTEGIHTAVAGAQDAGRRAAGADVAWSRDWATSLDDVLMDRVDALLAG